MIGYIRKWLFKSDEKTISFSLMTTTSNLPKWKPFGMKTSVKEIDDELGFPIVVLETAKRLVSGTAIIKPAYAETTRAEIERNWLWEDIDIYVVKEEVKVIDKIYDYQITSFRDKNADMVMEFRNQEKNDLSRLQAEALQAK